MVQSDVITFAIIGHGQAGNSFYNALNDLPGVQLNWVIGRRPEATAQFAQERDIPNHGIELEAALTDPAVDVVLICTPNELHYNQTMLALQAGKHVVVEVPLAMSYLEAQELVDVALEKECFLSVSHNTRYVATYTRAKELVSANELGQIYQVVYRRLTTKRETKGWTGRPRSWVDSVAWHHTAHAADLASWLLNEPFYCKGAAIGYNTSSDQSTDISAVLTTPSETIVTLTLSYNSSQELFDCVLIGENGTLELEDFITLRRDGTEILREQVSSIESVEQAYRRYALELVAGLRGERPIPNKGSELLPVIEQLDAMHALAEDKTWSTTDTG